MYTLHLHPWLQRLTNLRKAFQVFYLAVGWYWQQYFFFKGLITFQRSQRGQKEDKEVFSFPIELKNQGNNWKLKLPPENFLQLKILYVLAAKPIRFLSTCIPLANVVSVVTHFPLLRNGRKWSSLVEEGNKIGLKCLSRRKTTKETEKNKNKSGGFWTWVEKRLAGAVRNFKFKLLMKA